MSYFDLNFWTYCSSWTWKNLSSICLMNYHPSMLLRWMEIQLTALEENKPSYRIIFFFNLDWFA